MRRCGRRTRAWRVAALFVLLASTPPAAAVEGEPRLERVVMVSRHGVRAPIRSGTLLNTMTKRVWPIWPVAAGQMTEHGARNLALMADYLKSVYTTESILPASGCPASGAMQVWADVADLRTRQSGQIFAERLAPGCQLLSRHAGEGTVDPIFNAMDTKACPVGMIARGKALIAAARDDSGLLRPEDRKALETLQGILAPDACGKGGPGVCLVPAPDASIAKSATSLALGSTIAEGIYLEYVQGLPLSDVGWGGVADGKTIEAIMPVHNRGMGILRRTPMLAARRGAVLARSIMALLQGQPLPDGAPALSGDTRLLMIAGHDSNLLYLAGLFGLDWRLPNQPSLTPPDATLAFELWREPKSGTKTVRVVLYAQTLEQLRGALPLTGEQRPDAVSITPEACAGKRDACTVDELAAGLEKTLGAICE